MKTEKEKSPMMKIEDADAAAWHFDSRDGLQHENIAKSGAHAHGTHGREKKRYGFSVQAPYGNGNLAFRDSGTPHE